MGYGLYLYGIFPAPGPKGLHLEGLDKQPVYTYKLDDFVFLYSEAQQERYLASRKNLLGHERVLEQAMEHGYRTLLPIPFNRFILQDWDSVAEQFINPHHDSLKELFNKLEGRREVSVKLRWNEEEEQHRMMAEHSALQAEYERLKSQNPSRDQLIAFGQATKAAMVEHQEAIIQEFRDHLNPIAVEMVENEPQSTDMIYNAAFLIPWDAEPEFEQHVEALDHKFENRLTIRYNAFTAPYNFAQLS